MPTAIIYYDPVAGVQREVDFPTNYKADKAAVTTAAQGVNDATDAAAGSIGELLTTVVASGAAVSVTTATAVDIATLALTAGDWDIYGAIVFVGSGTTSAAATPWLAGISTTLNTQPTSLDQRGSEDVVITTTSVTVCVQAPFQRMTVSSATTLHLVATGTFSAGTMTAYGRLIARRAR